MRKIRIFDNSFMGHSRSASLREENKDVTPTYFEWTDEGSLTKPTFFTSDSIKNVAKFGSAPGKIAWLLEPRCLRPENYEAAKENQRFFDAILTYDKEFINEVPNAKFYPFGGSSIAFDKWGIYPKTKDICMIVSDKQTTEGHEMRHRIARRFGEYIDFFGSGVGRPFESKFEVLKDYRFAVVIESCIIKGYFTEKWIDPFSVGTLPLYLGSFGNWGFQPEFYVEPPIKFLFDSHTDIDTLVRAFNQRIDSESWTWEKEYNNYIEFFPKILEFMKAFRITEDWIFTHYPELFA